MKPAQVLDALSSTTLGVCLVNHDGRIVYLNQELASVLGVPFSRVLGRPITDFLVTGAWSGLQQTTMQRAAPLTWKENGALGLAVPLPTTGERFVWLALCVSAQASWAVVAALVNRSLNHIEEGLHGQLVAGGQPPATHGQPGGDFEMLGNFGLTRRQREVAKMLLKSTSTHEIAGELGISLHTVRGHMKVIYKKLAVHSRVEFARRVQSVRPKPEHR